MFRFQNVLSAVVLGVPARDALLCVHLMDRYKRVLLNVIESDSNHMG